MQVSLKRTAWDYFVDVLAGLAVAAALVSVIFAVVFANRVGVEQVYLVGSQTLAPLVSGYLTTDSETDRVTYKLRYASAVGVPLSVVLVGPLDVDTQTGPIFFGLCGCPPSVMCGAETPACDTSVPNVLEGSLSQIQPGGISLLDPIRELRANRMDYELRVYNATYATGFGAFRSKLVGGGALQ